MSQKAVDAVLNLSDISLSSLVQHLLSGLFEFAPSLNVKLLLIILLCNRSCSSSVCSSIQSRRILWLHRVLVVVRRAIHHLPLLCGIPLVNHLINLSLLYARELRLVLNLWVLASCYHWFGVIWGLLGWLFSYNV